MPPLKDSKYYLLILEPPFQESEAVPYLPADLYCINAEAQAFMESFATTSAKLIYIENGVETLVRTWTRNPKHNPTAERFRYFRPLFIPTENLLSPGPILDLGPHKLPRVD